MDILELRSLMIDACPFECEPSIRFSGDSITLVWYFNANGVQYIKAEAIPVRAIEQPKAEMIKLAIQKSAASMSERADCFK